MQTNLFAFSIFAISKHMDRNIEILKGIHPGKIIGRELTRRGMSQRAFASDIKEHSQTLNAVITGRRHLTTEMALKIEKALGYEEGFLLTLQVYHAIAEHKNRMASSSVIGVPDIRKSLFWDTDFDSIDWGRHKDAVIRRILERGNNEEKIEIARFYHISESELNNYKTNSSYQIKDIRQ